MDRKIVLKAELVNDSMGRIKKLLSASKRIRTTAAIKRAATDRALAGQAPYHRDRNGVGDAILIESYAALLAKDKRQACAFVTHNFKDFSQTNGDRRQPHADLAVLFGKRSTYWISLVDLIKSLDAELLEEIDAKANFSVEPRRLSEILDAEQLLFRQVWYNRHMVLREAMESGRHRMVPDTKLSRNPYRSDETAASIWSGALAAAKRTEDEVGLDNLGPWDDFDWGMINGKLSALRWVLGDEWDMLDT